MTVWELRTELLPAAERLSAWRKQLAHALAPVCIRTTHADDFRATLRLVDLGAVRVAEMTSPPLEALQCGDAFRLDGPEQYGLVLNRGGVVSVADGYRTVALAPGDLTFYDMSRPFAVCLTASDQASRGSVTILAASVPRTLMPVRRDRVERHLVTRFPGDEAMVSLLSRHLQDLVRDANRWRAADQGRLAATTVDLIAAVLAGASASADGPPQQPARLTLQNEIHTYIQRHLGDPGLTPGQVAAAHQISVRYLHQLFREQGLTIAAWIRECRLERCCRDLADVRNLSKPIHAIAVRWGFTDAAHFSRLFRTAYGMPPSEYRTAHTMHAYPTGAHATSTTS